MEKQNEFILDTLSKTDCLYLKRSKGICKDIFTGDEGKTNFLAVYRVDEVTFEDKAPRKEALENVISSMNLPGVNFVYIIKGDNYGVGFYYGVARDFSSNEQLMEISDIGTSILKPSLQGNFRGSKISELDADEKKNLLNEISEMKKAKILEGVPGINKDDESFQSVDRIIDVMLGNKFAIMLIAKPLSQTKIVNTQEKMYQFYDLLNPISKTSIQESTGKSEGSSTSKTEGGSKTKGTSYSETKQDSKGTSTSTSKGESNSKSTTHGISKENDASAKKKTTESTSGQEGTAKNSSKTDGTSTNHSESETTGNSSSETESSSEAQSTQTGTNIGTSTTLEIVNKKVQEWIKYIDEVILPRLDYGTGKGLFVSSAILLGNDEANLVKLENTIRSIYGGESGNRMPLKAFELDTNEKSYVRYLQIPSLWFENELNENEMNIRMICSQIVKSKNEIILGSWMSSKELSLFAGLPQKEVVGLALREEVEFGLNVATKEKNPVLMGHLIQSGVVLDGRNGAPKIEVNFEKDYFDKHIFVTGVTGSGKTTTCQKLLLESNENFMVIEPAKTEYRILTRKFPDMLVFTLGKETAAPFRLNPFEFFPGESITSRVDMIKASMEAAFDMEAAIPQILETAIYQCYEEKGWDISTNKNRLFENPFDGNTFAFPTLGDLDRKIETVVEQQKFDGRLKNDYIGSIKARLKGLLVGAKGLMLNTPRSLNFVELLDKKVVLELENIKSASEKSLIMGFILANLSEAIKAKYNEKHEQIQHITLIEEAHRLLSKYMPGDSMNKKQGVEMFSDMLAEVRKYGESLIISDQIPNKLTPEVLKNTNTKIVHKIFAQDDKEAIGNTMALKDEQKVHLSYLEAGSAIMMNPGLSKAIQLKILQTEDNDTSRIPPEDEELRKICLEYYAAIYKQGIMPGMETLKEKPAVELVEMYLTYFHDSSRFIKQYKKSVRIRGKENLFENEFIYIVRELHEKYHDEDIARIILYVCYAKKRIEEYPDLYEVILDFIRKIVEYGNKIKIEELEKIDYLEVVKE